HDRADVGLGRALDDRVDRIADQELDPLRLQDMGDGVGDFHRGSPRREWPVGFCCQLTASRGQAYTRSLRPPPPTPSARAWGLAAPESKRLPEDEVALLGCPGRAPAAGAVMPLGTGPRLGRQHGRLVAGRA